MFGGKFSVGNNRGISGNCPGKCLRELSRRGKCLGGANYLMSCLGECSKGAILGECSHPMQNYNFPTCSSYIPKPTSFTLSAG